MITNIVGIIALIFLFGQQTNMFSILKKQFTSNIKVSKDTEKAKTNL